jgi:hypothetical protein
MTSKLSRATSSLLIVGGIILWFTFPAIRQYTWESRTTPKVVAQGWTAVGTVNNYVSLASPWSLVVRPPASATFVRRDDARVTEQGWLIVRYAIANNTALLESNDEGSQGFMALDCVERRFATVPQDLASLEDLNWYKAEKDMPGTQVLDYACVNYR